MEQGAVQQLHLQQPFNDVANSAVVRKTHSFCSTDEITQAVRQSIGDKMEHALKLTQHSNRAQLGTVFTWPRDSSSGQDLCWYRTLLHLWQTRIWRLSSEEQEEKHTVVTDNQIFPFAWAGKGTWVSLDITQCTWVRTRLQNNSYFFKAAESTASCSLKGNTYPGTHSTVSTTAVSTHEIGNYSPTPTQFHRSPGHSRWWSQPAQYCWEDQRRSLSHMAPCPRGLFCCVVFPNKLFCNRLSSQWIDLSLGLSV